MLRTRRDFLSTSTAIAAGLAATSIRAQPYRQPVLEKLRVGVVGFRGRGKALINAVNKSDSAIVVALADVDKKILAIQNKGRTELFRTGDFREILDRKDIDIIVSATPNHWHALLTVMAVQAGKHVYIEKPISHNMFESEAVVAAAQKYGKLVQCGFQNRSDNSLMEFYQRLGAGEFGAVLSVQGTCHRPRASIGKLDKPLSIPSHIDYSLWLGPAADESIFRSRFHYDWHWDFNTGNGDVGNQGPHEWDLMNWALGDTSTLPTSIRAAGNRFGWNDAGNTPNVMAVAGVKDGIAFTFEVMDLKPGCKAPQGMGVGVIIETEKGSFVGGRGGGKFTSKDGGVVNFKKAAKWDSTNEHMQNFFDSVLANDRGKLRSDCRVAAKSCSMAHMANISYRLGAEADTEEIKEAFLGQRLSTEMVGRLAQAPAIFDSKLAQPSWMLGPELTYSNTTNTFEGDVASQASALTKRKKYRPGFEFPVV